jgi:hypothetical protein
MKLLLVEIKQAERQEYIRASEKFGKANNSDHESYAVILEEFQEAQEASNSFDVELSIFWDEIKKNLPNTKRVLYEMQKYAEKAAAEWVQVAAMCYKAMQRKEDAK